MKQKLIFCLILIFLVACKEKKNEEVINLVGGNKIKEMICQNNSNPFILTPNDAKDFFINHTDTIHGPYISEQQFIPLDFKNGPIGSTTKMLFFKDRIYILDDSPSNESVFIYDNLGNSIKKISDRGKGPKEFYGVGDICIDEKRNELLLTDRLVKRILFFDLDGVYLRTEATKLAVSEIGMVNQKMIYRSSYNQNWLIENLNDYPLYVGNKDTILFKGFKYLPYEETPYQGSKFHLFMNYNGDLLFSPSFSDSIFKLTSDSMYCLSAYFKFSNSMYKELAKLKSSDMNAVIQIDQKDYEYNFGNYYNETENSIFYACKIKGIKPIQFYIFDKKNKVSYNLLYDKNILYNKINIMSSWPISVDGNYFIGLIENSKIAYLKKSSVSINDKQLEKYIKNASDECNPIIVRYHYKFR